MENIKIYLFEDSASVVTMSSKEDTVEWYKIEFGFDEDDELEVEERSLDDKMWFNEHIPNTDELPAESGKNYMIIEGEVFELMTFRDVLNYLDDDKKVMPFIIASMEF